MRIVRFGRGSWGVVEGEVIRVTRGPAGPFTGKKVLLSEVKLLPPARPTKIVCVGRNYRKHAEEMGEEVPPEPGLFLKAPNALAAPGADIPYPSFTKSFHYEGELAVVIGRRMRRIPEEKAPLLRFGLHLRFGSHCPGRAKDRSPMDPSQIR